MLKMGIEKAKFITENYPDRYSVKELVSILDENIDHIRYFIRTRKLCKPKGRNGFWTKDKLQFLYDHRNQPPRFIIDDFNKEFNSSVSLTKLYHGIMSMRRELLKDDCILKTYKK